MAGEADAAGRTGAAARRAASMMPPNMQMENAASWGRPVPPAAAAAHGAEALIKIE